MIRKILILLTIVFLFAAPILANQEKLKAKQDLIAYTSDGQRVLLHSDGTWEFAPENAGKHEPTMRLVKEWKGEGIKNTGTFDITTKTWAVVWSAEPRENAYLGLLQIFVYQEGKGLVGLAANITSKGADNSVFRGKGQYWLDINAGNMLWTVGVYEIIE
ncbi:MAG: hypothetical protein ACUVWQ_11885 [Candidatus Aminicenantales bacterium]